jgi:hypothetical protein
VEGCNVSGWNVVEIFISSDLWLCPPGFLHLAGLANGKEGQRENIKMKQEHGDAIAKRKLRPAISSVAEKKQS